MRTMTDKIESGREHAAAALAAYRAAHVDGAADDEDVAAIGDLIADLLHLADSLPTDDASDWPPLLLDRASDHYEYERDPAHADENV